MTTKEKKKLLTISKLDNVNKQLDILLGHGQNDEKLVDKKRLLESILRNG